MKVPGPEDDHEVYSEYVLSLARVMREADALVRCIDIPTGPPSEAWQALHADELRTALDAVRGLLHDYNRPDDGYTNPAGERMSGVRPVEGRAWVDRLGSGLWVPGKFDDRVRGAEEEAPPLPAAGVGRGA